MCLDYLIPDVRLHSKVGLGDMALNQYRNILSRSPNYDKWTITTQTPKKRQRVKVFDLDGAVASFLPPGPARSFNI